MASASSDPGRPAAPSGYRFKLDTPPALGKSVMVVTDAALATQVGVDVLKRGGNAVDAAVATALALAVVYPAAGNIGGGGFMVLRTAEGKVAALDFRETAPKQATATMFKDKPKWASLVGHLAAGVPGSVAGLWEAHKKYGSQPWADLCAPAIKLAEEGFKVDERFAETVKQTEKNLANFPGSAALFLPSGKPLAVGDTWKDPDLGKVLRRISEKGPAGFYEGETADLIAREMQRGKGLITKEDLKGYSPKWRDPIEVDYRGNHVISMPPPSSGGLALGLMLKILSAYDLEKMGWHSAEALHLETEAMRRAFAMRNELLGDPDFVKVDAGRFLSDASVDRLRASIKKDKATPSAEVTPDGIGFADEKKHTTHFSVVDAKGAAVALTTTVNTLYGSAVTVQGAGFLLNNEMDDFATEPGKPNVFGLVQGEANAIAPGKRMLSSMTPTVVVGRDGKVLLVTGAAGGPTIITAVFNVLTNVLDYHMDIAAAVSAPRIHHQHLPDELRYEEAGLPAEVLTALGTMGHKLATRDAIADAPSIMREPNGGWGGGKEVRNSGSEAMGD